MYIQENWEQIGMTDTELPILKAKNGLKCIFKSQVIRHEGVFNEYLAYKIGQELSYSIPKIEFTDFNNEFGSISHFIPDTITWDKREKKRLINMKSLAQVIIFDMWIGNTNRGFGNLLVKEANNIEYEIYMIDHEKSLYIHNDEYMKNLSQKWKELIKIPELKEFNDEKKIYEEYEKIINLDFIKISNIIDQLVLTLIDISIAKEKFIQTDAEIIKNLLFNRRELLMHSLDKRFKFKDSVYRLEMQ